MHPRRRSFKRSRTGPGFGGGEEPFGGEAAAGEGAAESQPGRSDMATLRYAGIGARSIRNTASRAATGNRRSAAARCARRRWTGFVSAWARICSGSPTRGRARTGATMCGARPGETGRSRRSSRPRHARWAAKGRRIRPVFAGNRNWLRPLDERTAPGAGTGSVRRQAASGKEARSGIPPHRFVRRRASVGRAAAAETRSGRDPRAARKSVPVRSASRSPRSGGILRIAAPSVRECGADCDSGEAVAGERRGGPFGGCETRGGRRARLVRFRARRHCARLQGRRSVARSGS